MNWRRQALCLGADPDIFYPSSEGRGHNAERAKHIEHAKSICGACPVQYNCLEWALETDEPEGIWGGLDTDERRKLKGTYR